jgi:hypothetical protein
VKKLEIKLCASNCIRDQLDQIQYFCRKIQNAAPNIEELKIIPEMFPAKDLYLEEMISFQARMYRENKQLPFKNLAFFNIDKIYHNEPLALCLEFLQPLRGLKIRSCKLEDEIFGETLERILNKHSNTLEKISLTDSGFNLDRKSRQLCLPPMLKLTKFELAIKIRE